MQKIFIIILFGALAAMATGCGSTRKIESRPLPADSAELAAKRITDSIALAGLKEEMYERVMLNSVDFKTFTSRVKVEYQNHEGQKNNATANVRMASDSIIWISLSGALGVEGFRVRITPDSVIIMDKLERSVTYAPLNYLKEMTQLSLTFKDLQDMLIGNPVLFTKNLISITRSRDKLILHSVGENFENTVALDSASNQMEQSFLEDLELPERNLDIRYGGYVDHGGKRFSEVRSIIITNKTVLQLSLDFKQVVFDAAVDFPFNIPRSYEVFWK